MKPGPYTLNHQARLMLTISTPVRQAEMQMRTMIYHEERGFIKALHKLLDSGLADSLARLLAAEDPSDCDLPAEHIQWLAEMGVLMPAEEVARTPIFEPELTQTGTPDTASHTRSDTESDLVLNPGLCEQSSEAPPPGLAEWLPGWEYLSRRRPLIWLPEPRSRARLPVWLTPELLDQLRKGGAADPALQPALRAAGMLLPATEAAWLGPERRERIAALRAQLQGQAYLHLRGLLPPLQRRALGDYAHALAAEGFFQGGDAMVPERRIIHNEPLMRFLHLQLTPFLQELVGEPLKASYALLADYGPGSILRRHTDRSQCDWNLSLVLDHSPAAAPWPIWIENAAGPTPVALEVGDMVFYSGTRTPHWRDQLPPGRRVTVALFHFVSASYSGSLL